MPLIKLEFPHKLFFYGWLIVAIAIVGGAFHVGIAPWALSALIGPMETELGWSRSTIFGALTLRTLLSGILAPFLWPFMDKPKGAVALATLGALSLGLSLIGLKFIETTWEFYLLFGVVGSGSTLGSGFFLAQTIVPKWFISKRGRALGIATMGTGAGAFFPFFIQPILQSLGWRDTWFVLGITSIVLLIPLALLIRRQPEDIGLLPDGEKRASMEPGGNQHEEVSVKINSQEKSLTRHQVVRLPVFWLLVIALSMGGFGLQGYQPNWLPYLTDNGISASKVSYTLTLYAFFSMGSRLVWGALADKVPARYLLTAQACIIAISVVLLLNVNSTFGLIAFVIVSGTGIGGWVLLQPLIVADYFGRAHLGSINGVMRPILTVVTATSPLVIASMYDASGSYFSAFILIIFSWIIMGGMSLIARPSSETRIT